MTISIDFFVRLVNGFDATIQSHRPEFLVVVGCSDRTVQMTESELFVLDFDSRQDVHRNRGRSHFHFFRETFLLDRGCIVWGQVLDIDARVRVLDTGVQAKGLDIVVQVIFVGR